MPQVGPTEIIIIAVVVLILFGTKKLPDASRALGRSMRIFKSETKDLRRDDDDKDKDRDRDRDDRDRDRDRDSNEPAQASDDQQHPSSGPHQLPTSDEQPVVNGKVVDSEQASNRH